MFRISSWFKKILNTFPENAGFGLLCILFAWLTGILLTRGLSPVSFPDTVGYEEIRNLIQQSEWRKTRFGFRGQTFPIALFLAQIFNLRFTIFVSLVSAFAGGLLYLATTSYSRLSGFITLGWLCLYLTSREHLSWQTCLLTESLQFGCISIFLAACIVLEKSFQNLFSLSSGTKFYTKAKLLVPPTIAMIIAVGTLHSLKPWLLLLPAVYAFIRPLVSICFVTREEIRQTRQIFFRAAAISAIVFLAITLAKVSYVSGFSRGPGNANTIAFLTRERSDLFLAKRLASVTSTAKSEESARSAELRQLLTEIGPGIQACAGRAWNCDLKWAGVIGSPWTTDSKRPFKIFETIYLRDLWGLLELLKISVSRIALNLNEGLTFSTYYGHQRGHELLKVISPIIFWIWLVLILRLFFKLTEAPTERFVGLLGFSAASDRTNKLPNQSPSFSPMTATFSLASLILFAFLTIGGPTEEGRNEAAGVYVVVLSMIMMYTDLNKTEKT